jgi:glycosyltransferase involved in cell wall biosynthesis
MKKPLLLFRGPVKTRSGYGSHSRDLLESLRKMDIFEIIIDSCAWGSTPLTALEKDNEFHNWIETKIISSLEEQPDFYIQVTVPNEFQRVGKFNIGITAGIETTVAPKEWIDGCNRMDMIITTSNFSRDVLLSTVYNEQEKNTNKLVKQHRIEKPTYVLFEGVDTNIYKDQYTNFDLNINEDFAFLFVGHWLKGDIGHDRKDVGMTIKCFAEAFKNEEVKPALILKTSLATFSVKEREIIRNKIEDIVKNIENPPSIYLLFGELTDSEMNELYNHPKIKCMVSITKGEGFGRPLLEFSMTGKPIIASNWSGQKDFLPMEKAVMIGGNLNDVHPNSQDKFIIKGSKWFTANYEEFVAVMKLMYEKYEDFTEKSNELKEENKIKFSLNSMKEKFEEILKSYLIKPTEKKLVLPELKKIN